MVNGRRRIVFYNDGRHTHLYELEPPITFEQLCMPVDEIVGTMVDTLVLQIGGGTTFFHKTEVGDLWGALEEEKGGQVWNHIIWYRPSETIRKLFEAGYDQLRVLTERAHQKGLELIPSLWTNLPATFNFGDGRLDHFRRDHPEYQLGPFPEDSAPAYAAKFLDFTYKEVRDERLTIIREVCERYPVDGIELDMQFPSCSYFFKHGEGEKKHEVLTGFVRDVRRSVDKSGKKFLWARLPPTIEGCSRLGIDAATWIREGLLDAVVPMGQSGLIDVNFPLEEWVEAVKGSGCKVYGCITPAVHDDRRVTATVGMYRAAALNYWRTGVDGIYLHSFYSRGYPFIPEDYTILREIGDADIIEYKDKHYWIKTKTWGSPEKEYLPPRSQLPMVLEEATNDAGKTVRLKVSDNIDRAAEAGILRLIKLRFRIKAVTLHDVFSFKLNGASLSMANCQKMDFTYRLISPARSIERRIGTHYVFDFDLTRGPLPNKGWNDITVNLEKRDPNMQMGVESTNVVLNDVELLIRYRLAKNYPTFEEEKDL
jgi:hypothetical protein